jgi:lysophospholipase L1-like esterase
VSTVTTTLQSIRAALNTAIPIIVITPFNQTQAGNIASGIVATSDPFIYSVNLGTPGTYGIQSASTGATLFSYDGLHPNAYNHGRLATLLAQALQRMFPVNGQTVVTVGQ